MSTSAVAATPVQDLQSRLADPATAANLARIADRSDLIVFLLDAIDGFLRRSDTVVESVSAGVRDMRETAGGKDSLALLDALPQLARSSVELADVASRPAFSNLLRSDLVDRLGDPRTIVLLDTLLDRLEMAVFLLDAIDGFLRRSDEIAESASAIAGELRGASAPIDLSGLKKLIDHAPSFLNAVNGLSGSGALDRLPDLLNTLSKLAQSGMFDPKLVEMLGRLGQRAAAAFTEVEAQPVQPLGLFGLIGALKEPEVQRTIGLLVAVARRFGRDVR